MFPPGFDNSRKYPILVEVYGGPGLGKVYDQWSGDLKRQWWAREGIIQVWIDNRSSGHFGRAGMDAIYKQCGKPEVDDFLACARWLRQQAYTDTNRICITGYSYGGFMTCMAMTSGAGLFTHGLAYYPLTDWACYDSYYTEKYMGNPTQNAEGYRITSPINYADKYKGLLRIVHGEADDNVHIRQTFQLINKLQDLHKHVELMIYPGEKHGRGLWSPSKRAASRYEDCRFYYEQLLGKSIPAAFDHAQ
jgi:dipeptidyl-peptidase-4